MLCPIRSMDRILGTSPFSVGHSPQGPEACFRSHDFLTLRVQRCAGSKRRVAGAYRAVLLAKIAGTLPQTSGPWGNSFPNKSRGSGVLETTGGI